MARRCYPDDVEAVLVGDDRIRDAAVVGLDGDGSGVRVHAVLLTDDASVAEAVVRDANGRLAGHQQIRGWSVWPDEDFPRTPSMKVKKRLVLAALERGDGAARHRCPDVGRRCEGPAGGLRGGDGGRARRPGGPGPTGAGRSGSRLETDLGLDSLGRIELLSVIEEELGTFVDDGQLDPDVTVSELEGLVEAARETRHDEDDFSWPLNPMVRAVGLGIQELLLVPVVWLAYHVRVRGEHHLKGLEGPVIFVPNHHLHTDNMIILTHLPLVWRWRLSIAAAADDIFGNPLRGLGAAVIGNAFPLAREGAVRRSLELLGARLDRDFSILIYPEGELTVGGPLKPFKAGAGLVAVEGATPVVPMKVKIHRLSWVDKRGRAPLRAATSRSCSANRSTSPPARTTSRDRPSGGGRRGALGGVDHRLDLADPALERLVVVRRRHLGKEGVEAERASLDHPLGDELGRADPERVVVSTSSIGVRLCAICASQTLRASASVSRMIGLQPAVSCDLGRVASDGLAVASQDLDLVAQLLDAAHRVPHVGVARNGAERLLLAGAADHDRQMFLERLRVEDEVLEPIPASGRRRDRLAIEQPPHGGDRLVHPVEALAESRAELDAVAQCARPRTMRRRCRGSPGRR